MANRDLDFSPQVTQVTPQLPNDSLLTGGLEVMDQLAQSSAQAKALSATMQTSLQFRLADQQYRQAAASNPNDPEAFANLQLARKTIVDQMGSNVPSIAMRDYQSQTVELTKASDASNTLWATRQLMSNARYDLQTGYHSGLQQAAMDGRQFAEAGNPATEVEGALHYAQLGQQMMQFATPVIGADRAGAMLKNFQGDYTKTFVSSVAESNPQMANALLQQPAIAQHFTPQDIDDMQALIRKTTKDQQLIKSGQLTNNDGQLGDITNDPNTTYFEKRAKIDQLDMEGSITPKAASAARRVIKSANDLDAQTDTPTMSAIITQAYDLNANASTDADGYLTGVRNIQQQILEAQASGKLTAADARKTQQQVSNLTNAKLSSATNTAGLEFYDANQTFNSLPPESRGQATRALFYAGQGKNWTPDQYKQQANQIVDQINTQRRQAAQDTVNNLLPVNDSDFLKSIPNASPASIAATAKQYGISEAEVIQQLRIKEAARIRTQKEGVKRVAPRSDEGDGEEPDTSNGIKLNGPPPVGEPSIESNDNPENDDK